MSGLFSSAIMFVSILAIALAAHRADEEAWPENADRGPASAEMLRKEAILGTGKAAPWLHHTEKLHGPLYVRLEVMGAKPNEVGDVFVLRGIITTNRKPLQDTAFQWSVPKDLEIINGATSGTISVLSSEQPGIVELTLRKTSHDNIQVHLLASATNGQTQFAESAQFNSELQESFDAQKLNMKKATEAAAHKQLKVFH